MKKQTVFNTCVLLFIIGFLAPMFIGGIANAVDRNKKQKYVSSFVDTIKDQVGVEKNSFCYTYQEVPLTKEQKHDGIDYGVTVDFYCWKPADSYSKWFCLHQKGIANPVQCDLICYLDL